MKGFRVAVIAIVAIFIGCGGRGTEGADPKLIVNQTAQSDAFLAECWAEAQAKLTVRVDMNPTLVYLHGAAPVVLPGDARAATVPAAGIIIRSVPDTNGFIPCPNEKLTCTSVAWAISWAEYEPRRVSYAADLETMNIENGLKFYVVYEMESEIMHSLKYDTSGR